MKPKLLCFLVLAAVLLGGLDPGHAGAPRLSWSTVDGGGGASTNNGGRLSVSGTAGQPDSGKSASNDGQQ